MFSIREIADTDLPFIYSSWLDCIRHNSPWARGIPNDLFYKKHHDIIERRLSTGVANILCLTDDPDVIFGYGIIHTPTILDMIYVKADCRRQGLANSIINDLGIDLTEPLTLTFNTKDLYSYMRSHPDKRFTLNPYLLNV